MSEPAVGTLLNKLQRVKRKSNGGWTASCPTSAHKHGDASPSLSIDVAEGRILLRCFTGCSAEAIVTAMGLTMNDLFASDGVSIGAPLPFQPPRRNAPPVAIYEYRNHAGAVVAEKGRFEFPDGKKSFLWRAKGDSGWSGLELAGLKLTDLALWGAEALTSGNADQLTVFAEGEKATQACRDAGMLAVTFAGGSSTRDFGESLEILRGRRVALWPDNDPVGREYMALVEARLRGIVRELRLINVPLPPKGDAWEYFDQGGTAEALESGAAPLTGPSVDDLADDALRVSLPSAVGTVVFTFTEIEKSRRSFLAELAVEIKAPGYPTEPYTQRIDTLSHSACEALRRDLDTVFGKDLGWTRLMNTAFATGRAAFLSRDRSIDLYEIQDNGNSLFFLEPFLPQDAVTIWFGDGGSLKTYAAEALAFCVSVGCDYLGSPTKPGHVLVVDWEDSEQVFRRRMSRIARGLGFDGFSPGRISYFPARGIPLSDLVDSLTKIIVEKGTVLVIIDSIGPACGGEPEKAEVALAYMRAVAKLRVTTLHLAHITKEDIRRGHTMMPFGSVYFHDEARRTWFIDREQEEDSDDLDIGMFCRKVNDGPRPKPVALRVHFEGREGAVTLSTQKLSDVPSFQKKRPAKYQIDDFLARAGTATIKDLAAELELTEDAIEKALTKNPQMFVKVGKTQDGVGRGATIWGRVARDEYTV